MKTYGKLSPWDIAYAADMAIACLITYWAITLLLSPFVDDPTDLLGGMWLRLVDTVVGIATGIACKWIGSFLFYGLAREQVRCS